MTNRRLIAFSSGLGWIAIVHQCSTILQLSTGHADRADAIKSLDQWGVSPSRPDSQERSWIKLFQELCHGASVQTRRFKIDQSWMTPFQQRVTSACREIPRGETLTYGQLARLAGSPNASRAVGTVMAKNRYPLIVPCHRVVSSSGIGGFSAPNGIRLKKRLLQLEGITID